MYRWEANNDLEVRVSHKAKYQFGYEPFFICKKEVPIYDERFKGYGFARNTNVSC